MIFQLFCLQTILTLKFRMSKYNPFLHRRRDHVHHKFSRFNRAIKRSKIQSLINWRSRIQRAQVQLQEVVGPIMKPSKLINQTSFRKTSKYRMMNKMIYNHHQKYTQFTKEITKQIFIIHSGQRKNNIMKCGKVKKYQ